MIRLLIADDHTLVRQGIAEILGDADDIEVVAQAGDGKEAVRLAHRVKPDVALLDIGMPEMSGLDAAEQMLRSRPEIRVLMLTVHDQEEYLFRALQVGALGYVLKGADAEDLLRAIRAVHAGDVYIYGPMATKLVADYLQGKRPDEANPAYASLAPREREVLQRIADGRTNAQVADELHISAHTVQSHREHIMQKLNLHSRTELLKYGVRKGLVNLDA